MTTQHSVDTLPVPHVCHEPNWPLAWVNPSRCPVPFRDRHETANIMSLGREGKEEKGKGEMQIEGEQEVQYKISRKELPSFVQRR